MITRNTSLQMDGLDLLRGLPDACAAAAVYDPQYRAVLDKLKFGNEGERSALPQMSDALIQKMMVEIARVVRPRGHVFVWVDKYSLASAHYDRWLERTTKFAVVDLICWSKLRFGMGKRSRSSCEYVIVLRRHPVRADVWSDHTIPDCWTEHADTSIHPHAKPHVLMSKLIAATTKRGDLVVDPCAGGFGILEVCKRLRREFIGCDIVGHCPQP